MASKVLEKTRGSKGSLVLREEHWHGSHYFSVSRIARDGATVLWREVENVESRARKTYEEAEKTL